VPGLDPAAVAVVVTSAPETAETAEGTSMTALGPLRIASGSRPMLIAGIVVGLALLAVLAGLLLLMARRLAALQGTAAARRDAE